MFIPVKPDFPLPRFPVLTTLVCVVCVGVFLHQIRTWSEYESAFISFCDDPRGRLTEMMLARIAGPESNAACFDVLLEIDTSSDSADTIRKMAEGMPPLKGLSAADSRAYVMDKLTEQYRLYQLRVPSYPDTQFAYHTSSWNPIAMVRSSLSHGDWLHIGSNLIFFVAFATTVEVLTGSLSFIALIVSISVFSAGFASLAAGLTGVHYATLGLSGVVMGMIGIFAYLLPSGRIRCYYWFIVVFGSVAVPAWLLAIWYIGWDVYYLLANVNVGVVDVMAHVTGGAAGYLYGVTFHRATRRRIRAAGIVAVAPDRTTA